MSPTTDPSTNSDEPVLNRRRLLAVAGAGIAAAGLAPGVARGDDADAEVTEPSRAARWRLVARAVGDPTSNRLLRELRPDGARPRPDDAIVRRTALSNGDRYHTVALPIDLQGDVEAVLLWTDDGPFPTQLRTFDRDDEGVRMRTLSAEGDATVASTATVEPAFWWYLCSDLNWACVLSVAGAWAGAIASCGACVVDPSKLTCLACIGAVLAATGGTLGCEWCEG